MFAVQDQKSVGSSGMHASQRMTARGMEKFNIRRSPVKTFGHTRNIAGLSANLYFRTPDLVTYS